MINSMSRSAMRLRSAGWISSSVIKMSTRSMGIILVFPGGVLGVCGTFRHLFWVAPPQSAWSFGPYVIGVLALAVIVTPMFNAARGSILIPILFHLQMNLPIWPQAQPWESYLFGAVAVIIVIVERKSMLPRGMGVTEILAPAKAPAANASTMS